MKKKRLLFSLFLALLVKTCAVVSAEDIVVNPTRTTQASAATAEGSVSDLAGTWENSHGDRYVIDPSGQVKVYVSGDWHSTLQFPTTGLERRQGGYYFAQLIDSGKKWINGAGLIYVPAGTVAPGGDKTDRSRERLIIAGQGGLFQSPEVIYYRSSVKSGESSGMDVQSIAEGDYSSAVGTYVNDAGKVITISQDGVESFRDDATGILFTGDDEVEGVYTEFYEHQGGVVYPMEKVAYLPKGEEMILGYTSSSEMKMVTISEEVDSIVLSSSGGTPFTSREAVLSRVYRRQQTPTSEGLWDEQKAQKLADVMVSWGDKMGQPGYAAIPLGADLTYQGSLLDIAYSSDGQSDAHYTIVAAYIYSRGGGLSHIYHFAILPDGSTTVIYSERAAAPAGAGYIVSKLNTDNEELKTAFANLVQE